MSDLKLQKLLGRLIDEIGQNGGVGRGWRKSEGAMYKEEGERSCEYGSLLLIETGGMGFLLPTWWRLVVSVFRQFKFWSTVRNGSDRVYEKVENDLLRCILTIECYGHCAGGARCPKFCMKNGLDALSIS